MSNFAVLLRISRFGVIKKTAVSISLFHEIFPLELEFRWIYNRPIRRQDWISRWHKSSDAISTLKGYLSNQFQSGRLLYPHCQTSILRFANFIFNLYLLLAIKIHSFQEKTAGAGSPDIWRFSNVFVNWPLNPHIEPYCHPIIMGFHQTNLPGNNPIKE